MAVRQKSEGEKKEKAKSQEDKEKDQKEIDKVVEEMALFEIKQRKKDGDEEGYEELSNYWLQFKISRVEDEWNAERGVHPKPEAIESPE